MALIPFKLNTFNNYITMYKEPTFYFRYKPYNLPMRFIQICDFYLCVQRFVNIFDLQIRHRAVLRWVHIQMQSYDCNYIAKIILFVRNLYNLINYTNLLFNKFRNSHLGCFIIFIMACHSYFIRIYVRANNDRALYNWDLYCQILFYVSNIFFYIYA